MIQVSGHINEMATVVRFIPKSKFNGLSLLPGERIVAAHFDCYDADYATPLVAIVKDTPVSEAVPEGVVGVLPAQAGDTLGLPISYTVAGEGYNPLKVSVRKNLN